MIKKLITISGILAMALSFGLVVDVDAVWNDVYFAEDTTIGFSDLKVSGGSRVQSMVVNAATIDLVLDAGSQITFTSAAGNIMQLDEAAAGINVCNSGGDSELTVIWLPSDPTIELSLSGRVCEQTTGFPTISKVVVASTTTVTVTMSEKIDYVSGKSSADLLHITDGVTFVGAAATTRPTAVTAINGNSDSFTFTFPTTGLTGAGIKDTSVLTFRDGILKDNDGNGLAASASSVVTTLSSINQLYDFVFEIQIGHNFMSVPYNVKGPDGTAVNTNTKVGATYADTTGVHTYTILGSSAGAFTGATSFIPLDGYHINSAAAVSVYLRLNEDTSSILPYERTFGAAGWHIMGVASNYALDAIGQQTDDEVLSSLVTPSGETLYDRVLDISVGQSTDRNTDVTLDQTYDDPVWKSLLTNLYRKVKTSAEIVLAGSATSGIEFNHGEAYFIYITGANAKYAGERATDANIMK